MLPRQSTATQRTLFSTDEIFFKITLSCVSNDVVYRRQTHPRSTYQTYKTYFENATEKSDSKQKLFAAQMSKDLLLESRYTTRFFKAGFYINTYTQNIRMLYDSHDSVPNDNVFDGNVVVRDAVV